LRRRAIRDVSRSKRASGLGGSAVFEQPLVDRGNTYAQPLGDFPLAHALGGERHVGVRIAHLAYRARHFSSPAFFAASTTNPGLPITCDRTM
jgi:hypothetical protein